MSAEAGARLLAHSSEQFVSVLLEDHRPPVFGIGERRTVHRAQPLLEVFDKRVDLLVAESREVLPGPARLEQEPGESRQIGVDVTNRQSGTVG